MIISWVLGLFRFEVGDLCLRLMTWITTVSSFLEASIGTELQLQAELVQPTLYLS